MKGMVFTEFLNLVEDRFSADMVDDIIADANVPSGAAYTSVGAYDHHELLALVSALSKRSGVPVPDLVRTFGRFLFDRLAKAFPQFVAGHTDTREFLKHVEDHIHVEVRKLYPDAELPRFEFDESIPQLFKMRYTSGRPFADLAYGMIEGCAERMGQKLEIRVAKVEDHHGLPSYVFSLRELT
jgi:hypothetical protein